MSKAKISALIGSILNTVVFILGAIDAVKGLAQIESLKETAINPQEFENLYSFVWITMIMIEAISVVILTFTWIAYAKIDTEKEKPWKIFLLILGILGTFFLIRLPLILSSENISILVLTSTLLSIGASICFILAFVFKEERNKIETKRF